MRRTPIHLTGNPRFDLLRPELRSLFDEEVARLRERISVSPRRPQSSPWLALLQRAVVEDRALFLRYRSFEPGDITERKVEPHAMAYYGEDWHVVAYCRLREAMRDFMGRFAAVR